MEERPDEATGVLVFDVYHGNRRLAWGLKDRRAAERWLARLGGPAAPGGPRSPAPSRAPVRPARPVRAAREDGGPPVRVWWGEHEEP